MTMPAIAPGPSPEVGVTVTSSLTREQTQVEKGQARCQHTNTVVHTKLITDIEHHKHSHTCTSKCIHTYICTCELESHSKTSVLWYTHHLWDRLVSGLSPL